MEIQNPTLPPLLGRQVTLMYLNTSQFNGKTGIVLGFNQERNRFIVRLDENTNEF